MPIIVSYEDINALGGAALQAGYQPGYAQGQQNYLQRQQADTHMLMNNAFQRQAQQRAFDQQMALQRSSQNFQAGQADLNRGFQASQNEVNFGQDMQRLQAQEAQRQQGSLQQYLIGREKDAVDFEQAKQMAELNDQLTSRRQLALQDAMTERADQREANIRSRDQAEVEAYVRNAKYNGVPPGQNAIYDDLIRKEASQILFQRSMPKSMVSPGEDPLSKLGSNLTDMGRAAAFTGDFTAVQQALDGIEQAKPMTFGADAATLAQKQSQILTGVQLGIQEQARRNPQALMQSLPAMPPQARMIAQQALQQMGFMNRGSNTSPYWGGQLQSGLESMSDEQLEALRAQLSGGR